MRATYPSIRLGVRGSRHDAIRAALTLILGILLVIDGDWDFGSLWITIAMVGWLVSFVLGFFYFRPEGERIANLVEEHGPGNAEADARLRRLNIIDRLQLMILFTVVFDMVVKPTGDDTGVLIVGAAILGAAIALGLGRVRGGSAASPAESTAQP
jgi:hypothetical protein